ncbi:MAG: thymidine phosphorylase [Oscillospiraceae bacterium]|jgi:pyrimidine-nucleoside phosphorylase|nr:thymidine phosphorylase [Oscillospiraceae bacterium]
MRMTDIIEKKKKGLALTWEEIGFFVGGFTAGEIPDCQAAALLMAICLRGMDGRETADLTTAMAASGDTIDLSGIPGVKVDKHSTGGVGDKTSLVVCPIVASCGMPVAKMSGRGLGHTGGTADKLESIPGLKTTFSPEDFLEIVRMAGYANITQSSNIAPADKKLYALRDVTATVDSIPLIAASVMSKKLATGADTILLDVKAGSGAFMKTEEDAIALARTMVDIGDRAGRRVAALVTNMDSPLGGAVGNALEVIEAVETLRGRGPDDLTEICLELAAYMLLLGGAGSDIETCRGLASDALTSGRAFEKLCCTVQAQGGDASALADTAKLPAAPLTVPFYAQTGGFLTRIDAEACGRAALLLGAGRECAGDRIDHAAGLVLHVKPGGFVTAGSVLVTLHTSDKTRLPAAQEALQSAFSFGETPPVRREIILSVIGV